MDNRGYEIIRQGYSISKEQKDDIIELYFKSLKQEEFDNNTDYIRQRLELKYGRIWSIIQSKVDSDTKHSFIAGYDLLLEFKTKYHHVLAFMVLPYLSNILMQDIPKPVIPYYDEYYYLKPSSKYRAPTQHRHQTHLPEKSQVHQDLQMYYPYTGFTLR